MAYWSTASYKYRTAQAASCASKIEMHAAKAICKCGQSVLRIAGQIGPIGFLVIGYQFQELGQKLVSGVHDGSKQNMGPDVLSRVLNEVSLIGPAFRVRKLPTHPGKSFSTTGRECQTGRLGKFPEFFLQGLLVKCKNHGESGPVGKTSQNWPLHISTGCDDRAAHERHTSRQAGARVHSAAARAGLGQYGGPGSVGLIEQRTGRWTRVIDGTPAIGARIISPIEDELEIQLDLFLILLEWHWDAGKPFPQSHRKNLVGIAPGSRRHALLTRTRYAGGSGKSSISARTWLRQNPSAVAQQVDFDEACVALKNLTLLSFVRLAVGAGSFI